MSRYESAEDAERAIAFFIASTVHAVRGEVQSPLQAAQDVQAAVVMVNIVCPCPSPAYWSSDRLYALAVDLADSIDHRADGMSLAGTLRAWVAGVERRRAT